MGLWLQSQNYSQQVHVQQIIKIDFEIFSWFLVNKKMPENLLDSKNLRNRVQKHQKIIWVQKCQKIGSKISENWPESNPAMTFLSHSRVFKIFSDIFDDFFNYLLCIISRHQCFDFHVIVGSDGATRFLFWRIARCRKIFWHKEQE